MNATTKIETVIVCNEINLTLNIRETYLIAKLLGNLKAQEVMDYINRNNYLDDEFPKIAVGKPSHVEAQKLCSDVFHTLKNVVIDLKTN